MNGPGEVGDKVVVSTVRETSQWLENVEANDATAVRFCARRHDTTTAVRRGPLKVATSTRSRAEQGSARRL